MKQKRLAIQFFGHLRTFDKTYQSFYENVVKPNEESGYKIDIFIHTWNESNSIEASEEYVKTGEYKKYKKSEISKKLTQLYSPKAIEIQSQIKIAEDDLLCSTQYNKSPVVAKNAINVWHSLFTVNRLRENYEKQEDISYDFVLVTRPDIYFKTKFQIDNYINNLADKYVETSVFIAASIINNVNTSGSMVEVEKYMSDLIFFARPKTIKNIVKYKKEDLIKDAFKAYIPECIFIKKIRDYGYHDKILNYTANNNFEIKRVVGYNNVPPQEKQIS